MTPEYLISPPFVAPDCQDYVFDTRGQLFEAFAKSATGRPRVTASGFGPTHLVNGVADTLFVGAWVHDTQDDLLSVVAQLDDVNDVNFSGLLNLTLTEGQGNLWSFVGPLPPLVLSDIIAEIVATDAAGNVSRPAPWISMGPGAVPGALPTVPVPNAAAPALVPRIQAAGSLGFEPQTGESERFVMTLYLTDANGGWWVTSLVPSASEQAFFDNNPGEALVEVVVWHAGYASQVWPRLTVH